MEAALAFADARPVTFVEVAERVLDDAYRLAGYVLGDASEAEDAVQEALTRSWQAWSTLRDQDRFEPWFDRILVNICRDKLRKHRRVRLEELNDDLAVYIEDPFRVALARAEVDKLMPVLSPDQRIAELLGVPLGTVQSRLHYALLALRKESERLSQAGGVSAEARR
jgi:RNA polymerase sigma-70 factor (ECF subfamily)